VTWRREADGNPENAGKMQGKCRGNGDLMGFDGDLMGFDRI